MLALNLLFKVKIVCFRELLHERAVKKITSLTRATNFPRSPLHKFEQISSDPTGTFKKKKSLLDQGPFCGVTDYPILDFVWLPAWILKPRWFSHLKSCLLVCIEPKGHVWYYTFIIHPPQFRLSDWLIGSKYHWIFALSCIFAQRLANMQLF